MIPWLHGEAFTFPPPDQADEEGLLAVGGRVTPRTLRRAYRAGIFPWPFSPDFPMLWFSPPRRAILEVDALHVPRRLRRTLRQGRFEIRWDTAFEAVIHGCARGRREGTWIDRRILSGFVALHESGRRECVSAHSVEAWLSGRLVGGLYGVAAGGTFAGESMFHLVPDASNACLVALMERMRQAGFEFLDCQLLSPHLERFGVHEIPRGLFLARLARLRDLDIALI